MACRALIGAAGGVAIGIDNVVFVVRGIKRLAVPATGNILVRSVPASKLVLTWESECSTGCRLGRASSESCRCRAWRRRKEPQHPPESWAQCSIGSNSWATDPWPSGGSHLQQTCGSPTESVSWLSLMSSSSHGRKLHPRIRDQSIDHIMSVAYRFELGNSRGSQSGQ